MKTTIINFIEAIFINKQIEIYDEYILIAERKVLIDGFWDEIENGLVDFLNDETTLYNTNIYETSIRVESYGRISSSIFLRNSPVEMIDESNGIKYFIGKPTITYLLFLIRNLSETNSFNEFKRRYSYGINGILDRRNREISNEISDEEDEEECDNDLTIKELLQSVFRIIHTVRIESDKLRTIKEFDRYLNSAIFQMGFKYDTPFIKLTNFEEMYNFNRRGNIFRRRDNLEAPRRFYNKDLIYHYQMALASRISYVEYISYYHVIEHFMEKIYTDEFINTIKDKITDPRFSFNRDKDIKGLIKVINDHNRYQREEITINEKEAIRLTLLKYIDISQLKSNMYNVHACQDTNFNFLVMNSFRKFYAAT